MYSICSLVAKSLLATAHWSIFQFFKISIFGLEKTELIGGSVILNSWDLQYIWHQISEEFFSFISNNLGKIILYTFFNTFNETYYLHPFPFKQEIV